MDDREALRLAYEEGKKDEMARITKVLMEMHFQAGRAHNFFQYAIVEINRKEMIDTAIKMDREHVAKLKEQNQ